MSAVFDGGSFTLFDGFPVSVLTHAIRIAWVLLSGVRTGSARKVDVPTFETRVFGSHAVDADLFWMGETTVSGCRRERSLHVWVDDQAVLDRAAVLVDSIEVLDARARKAIDDARSAPDGDTTVGDFVDDQLAEMDAETLFEVFGAAPSAIAHATFLGKLELRSVAVRAPDDTPDDGFALVLDYSLPGNVSDQLLVVTFTAAGEPVSVEWES